MKYKYFALLFTVGLLCGCSQNENNAYLNERSLAIGDLYLSFSDVSQTISYGDYSISFSLNVVNYNAKTTTFKINDPKVIRESNNAKYSVEVLPEAERELETSIVKTFLFTATIPTSFASENYYFSFKYSGNSIKYYLYDNPDPVQNTEEQAKAVDKVINGSICTFTDSGNPLLIGSVTELNTGDTLTLTVSSLTNVNGTKYTVSLDWSYEYDESLGENIVKIVDISGDGNHKKAKFTYPDNDEDIWVVNLNVVASCGEQSTKATFKLWLRS